ncbi:MAG TPA: YciI family protein [Edaphobacter sp.]
MRFMIMGKADKNTEAGGLPSKELVAAVGRYNEELRKAGVLLGGEWLQPSSKGARINSSGGKVVVTDGPFAEAKELIIGYVVVELNSMEEAIEWAKRCPTLARDGEVEMEIRQVFEAADFPDDVLTELTRHASAVVVRDAEEILRGRVVGKS